MRFELKEKWRPVVGFSGYFVSDKGRVLSIRQGGKLRFLHTYKNRYGYLTVHCRKDGRNHTAFVHALVLTAFVGACPDGFQCDHANTVRVDNRLENLRWVTPRENARNPLTLARHQENGRRRGRLVVCAETGETFDSVSDAARNKGVALSSVYGICTGRKGYKSVHGLHFRFVDAEDSINNR